MDFDWQIKIHLPTLQQHENNSGQALNTARERVSTDIWLNAMAEGDPH